MGQQQLLFLVLSIVVVSIAVFIGIDFFDKSSKNHDMDQLVRYTIDVTSDAVAWREKKSPYLGGGGSYAELETVGLDPFLINSNRPPGILSVEKASKDSLIIIGVSSSYPELGVRTRVYRYKIVETETFKNGEITISGS